MLEVYMYVHDGFYGSVSIIQSIQILLRCSIGNWLIHNCFMSLGDVAMESLRSITINRDKLISINTDSVRRVPSSPVVAFMCMAKIFMS